MQPKIIKSEEDYDAAVSYLESLMDSKPGTPEQEELELFAVLIENYEEEHFPIGMPDPVEAIKFRMEQQGLTRKDLVPFIGSQSKVSEVLNGKRPLSISMIRALEKGLGIPAEILLQVPGENQEQPDDEQPPVYPLLTPPPEKGFSGEIKADVPAQKLRNRQYPGLSAAAFQLMIANGLDVEAGRSDELLFGQWLKQKTDEIEKAYAANNPEESLFVIENMLASLVDSVPESPMIEGLVRVLEFQKRLVQFAAKTEPKSVM